MARFKKDFDWSQIERDNASDDEIIYVSKSEIKRDAQDYRKIAAVLVELNMKKILPLDLNSTVIQAIQQAKEMKNMEAKRRQVNFVAKQLRSYDLEELKRLLKESDPTGQVAAKSEVQIDKQIRAVCERLANPQFKEHALTMLSKQFADFDRSTVENLLIQETDSGQINSELWSYFYHLFREKITG